MNAPRLPLGVVLPGATSRRSSSIRVNARKWEKARRRAETEEGTYITRVASLLIVQYAEGRIDLKEISKAQLMLPLSTKSVRVDLEPWNRARQRAGSEGLLVTRACGLLVEQYADRRIDLKGPR